MQVQVPVYIRLGYRFWFCFYLHFNFHFRGGGGGPLRGEVAGDGEGSRVRREQRASLEGTKDERTELTKGGSLTKDTPRGAFANALRLHLHNVAYKTFQN